MKLTTTALCLATLLALSGPQAQEAAALNDAPDRAVPVTLTETREIVLTPDENGYARPYYYVLDIPEADANARFDAVLTNPAGASVQFAWTDSGDITFAQITGRDAERRFSDFVLGAGRHLIKIYPTFDDGVTELKFQLNIQRKADWKPGEEREPNENRDRETRAPISAGMSGVKSTDEDQEFFAFDVDGPMQLWTITARGETFDSLILYDGKGTEIARAARDKTTGIAEMWDVLLPPGRNGFRIGGPAGAWAVTATPTGPAPLDVLGGGAAPRKAGETDEVEPNNGEDRALLLPMDGSRSGRIEQPDDADTYRFTLNGPTKVRITLEGPQDIGLRARISRSNYWELGRIRAQENEPKSMDFELGQGDWFVTVRGDRREQTPYVLKLERLPWFGPQTDLEPNDTPWTAKPVPADLRLTGSLGYDDGEDMYRLPDLDAPATLTVAAAALPKGARLRVMAGKVTESAAGPIRRDTDMVGDLSSTDDGKTWTLALEPGKDRFLRIAASPGSYDLSLAFDPGPQAVALAATVPKLSLSANAVRAFDARAQRVTATLSVPGAAGDTPLDFSISDDRWRIEQAPSSPAADGTAQIVLIARPDLVPGADAILSVRVGGGTAEAVIAVTADAPAAEPFSEPALPPALLGGLNVAWSALGGSVTEGYEELIDGYATGGTAEDVNFSDEATDIVTIDLAGDDPVKLAGFTVNPTAGTDEATQVRRFRIETSLDGVTFTPALEAEVGGRQREYAFALEQPVEARFVRYRPIGTLRPDNGAPNTGEVKAIAVPEIAGALSAGGFNIADPRLGGYLAWWRSEARDLRQVLDADPVADAARFGEDTPREMEFVISFRNQRAARLQRIEWQDIPDLSTEEAIQAVVIETAMEPNGPWTKAGTWTLDRSNGQPPPFTFAADHWARFVRFAIVVPPRQDGDPTLYLRPPQQVRIIEQPADAKGGSIIGEWGEDGRYGPYEALNPPAAPLDSAARSGGRTKADALPLPLDAAQAGRVSAGTAEVWAIDVPEEGQGLTLTLDGQPTLGVTARLEDAKGTAVPLSITSENGQTRISAAKVTAGRYYAFVEEPPRSIAVVWDTSGSVSPYVSTIIQSIRSFVRYLSPGRDEVQLMAFDDPTARPLLSDWTGDPLAAFSALNGYSWSDSSSNAEGGALGGALQLKDRPGTRAIILITDFQTNGSYDQRNETLEALRKTGARVFAFAIPSDSGADQAGIERSLMQLLAAVSGGTTRYAGTTSDLELAFTRTAAALRAPKDYAITAVVSFKPPEPGKVSVVVPADAPPEAKASKDRAVLVILDASGSMLKRLGKKRRIEIAKDTLTALTQDMLPEGTPFAMRVFGDTKPDSCETNLRVPLAPLDRAAAKGAIDKIVSINKAKTAIGASLAEAASDLGGGGGQKLIVLITDGEETCDGDPLAEIGRLKEAGLDVRVSIVGFAVDDQALKDTFAEWAGAGGGGYFDATKPEELAPAVERALLPSFEVVAADGSVIATGVAGADAIEVPPGTYTIRVLSDPVKEYAGVVVESGGAVSVTLGE